MTAALHRVRDSLQGAPDPDRRRELQRILYGLYAIIRLHFAKEEELYLPLVDAGLGSVEAAEMLRAMHESAHPSGSADHEPAHHSRKWRRFRRSIMGGTVEPVSS